MIILSDASACLQLDTLLDGLDVWYHLYANDLIPDRSTSLGDLVEPDWDNYAPQQAKYWTPALIEDNRATSGADPLEWTRGPGGAAMAVYGYFTTNGQAGPLLWTERICGQYAISMTLDDDIVVVWPRYQGQEIPGEPCLRVGGVEIGGEVIPIP
jgi:hypothetical protein